MPYNYILTPKAVGEITLFYSNVALKYRHVYSFEDMEKNIYQAIYGAQLIEKSLPRRRPTIARWQDFFMAKAGKWYYAYSIEGNDIIIRDACHAQNMH